MSDEIAGPGGIRWARSATKHRISRDRSRYVIEHSRLRFVQEASEASSWDPRFLYLGDDSDGIPLEIVAIELSDGYLMVIHAMRIRERYLALYEEAIKWRQ